jgi:hypothetical protein
MKMLRVSQQRTNIKHSLYFMNKCAHTCTHCRGALIACIHATWRLIQCSTVLLKPSLPIRSLSRSLSATYAFQPNSTSLCPNFKTKYSTPFPRLFFPPLSSFEIYKFWLVCLRVCVLLHLFVVLRSKYGIITYTHRHC